MVWFLINNQVSQIGGLCITPRFLVTLFFRMTIRPFIVMLSLSKHLDYPLAGEALWTEITLFLPARAIAHCLRPLAGWFFVEFLGRWKSHPAFPAFVLWEFLGAVSAPYKRRPRTCSSCERDHGSRKVEYKTGTDRSMTYPKYSSRQIDNYYVLRSTLSAFSFADEWCGLHLMIGDGFRFIEHFPSSF